MCDITNMRFHDSLDDLLSNPIQLKVLRVLHKAPNQGFTGRELARLCVASPSQTIRCLAVLESAGVVTRETTGPSHVWRLAQEHLWFEPLARLFGEEARALVELKATIQAAIRELPVERAALFGSIARGDEAPDSDIDLFIEVRTEGEKSTVRESLSALSARFALRFGNPLSSLILTRSQVRQGTHTEVRRVVKGEGLEVGP